MLRYNFTQQATTTDVDEQIKLAKIVKELEPLAGAWQEYTDVKNASLVIALEQLSAVLTLILLGHDGSRGTAARPGSRHAFTRQ
jgi:hypothetical protein